MENSEIKQQYPKVYWALCTYAAGERQDLPEQVKQVVTPEAYMNHIVAFPSNLLAFFDSHELYLSVGRANDSFDYEIHKQGIYAKGFDTRLEAEGDAILELFKLLEKKLC